jgi:hypothetical protein
MSEFFDFGTQAFLDVKPELKAEPPISTSSQISVAPALLQSNAKVFWGRPL